MYTEHVKCTICKTLTVPVQIYSIIVAYEYNLQYQCSIHFKCNM